MPTLRWIEGEELDRLKPVIDAYGWTPLDPVFSKALIAEDEDGKLVGFNVLQVVLRPEPLWVDKAHRGDEKGLSRELSTAMRDHLLASGANYWEVKAWSPWAATLCKEMGMEKISTPMFAGGAE
jgi:hypothetical protein